MLTEICQYLKNWFNRGLPKYVGEFTIRKNVDDTLDIVYGDEPLTFLAGQYVRIVGSVLNDGVHEFPFSDLHEETFSGSVWSMAVPKAVVDLSAEIEAWQEKNGGVDSPAMSPYHSESFGGYSYTKGSSRSGDSATVVSWQSVFADRLALWKKLP